MISTNILNTRFHNQHLVGKKFVTPEEVVRWLGAVQSQDFPAAKWALGLRFKNSSDTKVEEAYNEGRILRTHVMRPTWHFVMPEDIYWIQDLTSARVKQFMKTYNKKLGLDDTVFAKTNDIIVKALEKHKYLTRQEFKDLFAEKKITTDVQKLAHIVSWAELDALICSGPRHGKQFTYALLSERAPKVIKFGREEALAKLAWRYFESHGPAQVKDFSWWSGLMVKDSQVAVELNKHRLVKETIEEKEYYLSPALNFPNPSEPVAFLLSIYDEYTIAYKDRSGLGDDRIAETLLGMGNALTAVVILNGKIVGTWKRKLKKDTVEFKLDLFGKFSKKEMDAIEEAKENYRKFIGNLG